MSSILFNQLGLEDDLVERTDRIYIDPQELMVLKKKRKSFKMVKSIYEPSQQDYELFDRSQNDKTTKCSSKLEFDKRNLSSPKLLNLKHSHLDNLALHQKIQSLQEIIENQKLSPNVQFIWKLFPSTINKEIISYQQGDCIPFQSAKVKQDDKFLILSGQVRVIGKNNNSFKRKAGYMYFLSNQTKEKIKQIIVLRSTKILVIPFHIHEGIIKPYLRLKYAQRLNFIHICPFFIWNEKLSEDLASSMQLILSQKQEIIYHSNQYADKILFVKQGIVLLERNTILRNPLIEGYQQHYQKNQITQKDVILVVRKGMVFGLDGVIVKQFGESYLPLKQHQTLKNEKEELQNAEKICSQKTQKHLQFYKTTKTQQRSNQRIYTARTLGKCELYCLDKKVLQTLFTMNDITQNFLINKNKISNEQLQRLSLQYTNMLVSHGSININKMPLKRKQIVLTIQNNLQQKSKSLAFIQQRSSFLTKNKKNTVQSPHKIPFHKRIFSQSQQKQQRVQEQKEYKRIYLDEEKQINQLRNRIKSQREKQKLLSIKKAIKQKQQNKNYIQKQKSSSLPKILFRKQLKSMSNEKQFQNQKLIKLDSIINKKLQQDLLFYNSQSPKLQKKQSIQNQKINKMQKSQLIKLLEQQNIRNKSNPSFINVKSYKSIGSLISSALKT